MEEKKNQINKDEKPKNEVKKPVKKEEEKILQKQEENIILEEDNFDFLMGELNGSSNF